MSVAAKILIPLALAGVGTMQIEFDSPGPAAEASVSMTSAAVTELLDVTEPAPIFTEQEEMLSHESEEETTGPVGLYLPAAVADWQQY